MPLQSRYFLTPHRTHTHTHTHTHTYIYIYIYIYIYNNRRYDTVCPHEYMQMEYMHNWTLCIFFMFIYSSTNCVNLKAFGCKEGWGTQFPGLHFFVVLIFILIVLLPISLFLWTHTHTHTHTHIYIYKYICDIVRVCVYVYVTPT